jgi:DNA-binding transcriptional ArsR family regulator
MSEKGTRTGRRIAQLIHLLVNKGSMSRPELMRRFPKMSESALSRNLKILKEEGLIKERRETRLVDGVATRKVFFFFKDDTDVLGRTRQTMLSLKKEHIQVTLDQIASNVGLEPKVITEAAYALARELDLQIGSNAIVAPPRAAMT